MEPVVLVTGGSGFIGTWVLRELLARGAKVVVVDQHPGDERWNRVLGESAREIASADTPLTDPERLQSLMEEHGVTHLIHLAALLTPACQRDPFLGFQVNVLGSVAIFEAARRSGTVKAISYASSYAVYGPEAEPDGDLSRPTTFYGVFKKAVDLIAEPYRRHFGIASVAVRPHVVYGPERDQGLTAGPSLAARAAAIGESYHIAYSGIARYDYVEDVATAFVRSAFECPPEASVVDLRGDEATPEEFVRVIGEIVPGSTKSITCGGPPIPVNVPPRPNSIENLFPDWQTTSLPDGVRKTVDFYRKAGS